MTARLVKNRADTAPISRRHKWPRFCSDKQCFLKNKQCFTTLKWHLLDKFSRELERKALTIFSKALTIFSKAPTIFSKALLISAKQMVFGAAGYRRGIGAIFDQPSRRLHFENQQVIHITARTAWFCSFFKPYLSSIIC